MSATQPQNPFDGLHSSCSVDWRQRMRILEADQYALNEHAIVATTDRFGVITAVNEKFCQLSGYSRDELIGRTHSVINSGVHPEQFFNDLWRTISHGHVWHGEVTNRAKDGSLYYVQTTVVPVRDSDGEIEQYIAIRTDITQQKLDEQRLAEANRRLLKTQEKLEQARQAAEAANRVKSQFLANMSHEIRTPMTAILGFTDLMLDPQQSPEDRVRCVTTIRRNGRHLLELINDILDLSKIEAGKTTIERVPCNPAHIICDAESLVRSLIGEKPIELAVEFVGPIPQTIQTDPMRLKQIVFNLLGNAVKFTEEGRVSLIAQLASEPDDPSPLLRIEVVDSGVGIEPDQLEHIFDAFHQADEMVTRRFGGSGLGLTISKHFAEALGGAIEIQSTPGEGSRFILTIETGSLQGVPMLERSELANLRKAAEVCETDQPTPAGASLDGRRILVAEDGPDNQRLIALYLEKAGAEVTLAQNGAVAVERAVASRQGGRPFDLILMDMQMPVRDGYAAAQELRQFGWRGPIVALTAHAMTGDRDKCLSAGCDEYLTKPIDRWKMLRLCAAMIADARVAA